MALRFFHGSRETRQPRYKNNKINFKITFCIPAVVYPGHWNDRVTWQPRNTTAAKHDSRNIKIITNIFISRLSCTPVTENHWGNRGTQQPRYCPEKYWLTSWSTGDAVDAHRRPFYWRFHHALFLFFLDRGSRLFLRQLRKKVKCRQIPAIIRSPLIIIWLRRVHSFQMRLFHMTK